MLPVGLVFIHSPIIYFAFSCIKHSSRTIAAHNRRERLTILRPWNEILIKTGLNNGRNFMRLTSCSKLTALVLLACLFWTITVFLACWCWSLWLTSVSQWQVRWRWCPLSECVWLYRQRVAIQSSHRSLNLLSVCRPLDVHPLTMSVDDTMSLLRYYRL